MRINADAINMQTSPMQASCDLCKSMAAATPSKSYIVNCCISDI